MKRALWVGVGSAVAGFGSLLILWRTTLSLRAFRALAEAEELTASELAHASQHISATLNLCRFISGTILLFIGAMVLSWIAVAARSRPRVTV